MAHHYSSLLLTGSLVDSLQGGFDDVSLHPGLGLPLHPYSSFIPAQNFLLKKIFVDVHVIAKKTSLGPVGDLCKCSEVCQPAISRWRPSENHLPRTCWSGDGIGDKASMREQKKRPVWRSSASMTTLPFFAGGGGTIAAVPLDPREPPFTCLLELAIWIFSHMHMCE